MTFRTFNIVIFIVFYISAKAQDSSIVPVKTDVFIEVDSSYVEKPKPNISYGTKGWRFEYDNKYLMNLGWRVQTRFMYQTSEPSFTIPVEDSNDKSFNLQRVRLKVGGYAFKPYINYYLEYDFPSNNLLNTVLTISKYDYFQVKVGQWKLEYNNERFVSSGNQQLVDRSISNRFFTLDRQIGVMVLGNLFKGSLINSSYYFGLFNGNGINTQNNDGEFMLFMRYQFNLWGKKIRTSFSDIARHEKPTGFIALAYMNNESRYTSFSSGGGGQLPGYFEEDDLFYRINQFNVESMFKHKGFSFSTETHLKNIHNDKTTEVSKIVGGYMMMGYFFSELASFVPTPLEFTARFAMIDNMDLFSSNIYEYIIGANWFFSGHKNKLTIDLSYIENQDFIVKEDNYRVRLQWDISF
ncbi:MAG: porin [Flavobacteriales bacterium]|nr:porin [Flavobacteriales bacterium]